MKKLPFIFLSILLAWICVQPQGYQPPKRQTVVSDHDVESIIEEDKNTTGPSHISYLFLRACVALRKKDKHNAANYTQKALAEMADLRTLNTEEVGFLEGLMEEDLDKKPELPVSQAYKQRLIALFEASNLVLLGSNEAHLKMPQGLPRLEKAIQIFRKQDDLQGKMYFKSLIYVSECYMKRRNYTQAEPLLEEAYQIDSAKHYNQADFEAILLNQALIQQLKYRNIQKADALLKKAVPSSTAAKRKAWLERNQ